MNRTVLIVDDSPVQCRLVEAAVLRAGWSARICTSAEAAAGILTRSGGETIDVVLLDLVMDGVGGLELLRRLRLSGNGVPVVVQTSRSEIAVVVECMREGARDFLVKPASAERIVGALEEAIRFFPEPKVEVEAPADPVPSERPRRRVAAIAPPLQADPVEVGRDGMQPSVALLDEAGEMRTMDAIETEVIAKAMTHYGGRRALVARRMGLGRSTLYRKLRSMPEWDGGR